MSFRDLEKASIMKNSNPRDIVVEAFSKELFCIELCLWFFIHYSPSLKYYWRFRYLFALQHRGNLSVPFKLKKDINSYSRVSRWYIFNFFASSPKTVKMRIAVAFFLLISMAMAFRLKLQEPALLDDERKDAAVAEAEEPGDLTLLEDEQEDPAPTDNEEPNDEPALFDDEKVLCSYSRSLREIFLIVTRPIK